MYGKRTILMAMRDEALAARLRREMEDEADCSVIVVSDGEAALRAARRFRPEVMVLDCILPQLDGPAVIDRLREEAGRPLPYVIGGAMLPFAERSLRRRGAKAVLRVPWGMEELREAIRSAQAGTVEDIDWESVERCAERAGRMLSRMGMQRHLRGYAYLALAAALACQNESRLYALSEAIYAPVAMRCGTSVQSVERLIRHAVERTMDAAHARGMYGFFGNTIDPTRGKPTNAQAIGMIAERLRTQEED